MEYNLLRVHFLPNYTNKLALCGTEIKELNGNLDFNKTEYFTFHFIKD